MTREVQGPSVSTTGRLTLVLVSLLAPLAAACDGSDGSTSEPMPASTVVSEAIPSSVSTSEPVDVAGVLSSSVLNNLDDFRGAVFVAVGDDVLLSKGYGDADAEAGIPNDPTTRFRLGSVTKQFTGLAILILREQGLLDVTGSVCEYLTRCPLRGNRSPSRIWWPTRPGFLTSPT